MNRTELTNIIGSNYLQTNCEEDEYSMPGTSARGNVGRADRVFNDGNLWIVVETKRNSANLIGEKPQLDRYVKWVWENKNPEHVIGILYNEVTDEAITFADGKLSENTNRIVAMEVYRNLFVNEIDQNAIYTITARINNNLHSNFGMTDLQDRMVFTACALVARSRFDCDLNGRKNTNFDRLKEEIRYDLAHGLERNTNLNDHLILLLESLSSIRINGLKSVENLNAFIDDVNLISSYINNINWNGEDVMAIFFNEFNRYRGASDLGQVFTPEHIATFMCKLLDIHYGDHVLDAACGSGTFLTKAMSIMLKEAGDDQEKREKIFNEGLYGVEYDKRIYTLAVSNMLIHKDGKTNLKQGDSRTPEIGEWIKNSGITKVIMNPPYEDKFGCITIMLNVLDNVAPHTPCAFILPNQKLTVSSNWKKFKNHKLKTIIKIPTETFDASTDTSIFIFEAGVPQGTDKICAYWIKEDGLVRCKNQGRHDINNEWPAIMQEYLDAVRYGTHETKQLFDIKNQQGYALPIIEQPIILEDFVKVISTLKMFENNIDIDEIKNTIIENTMYEVEE